MANINDVYNRLGAVDNTLGWIYTAIGLGTAATTTVDSDVKAGTTSIVNALTTIDNDIKAGTTATVNALQVLAEIEFAAVELLFHLTQQADTMICELGQISKNTCGILTQATIQTGLQQRISKNVETLLNIAEAANPAAALELSQLDKLRAQIEKCCPPRQPEPACTYQACPAPAPVPMPRLPVTKGSGNSSAGQ